MNPYALSIFISSLALGTVATLSSFHWILAWIGLEINTLAILPLMTKNPHPRAIEASTKYFLTQAAASALILFAATLNAWLTGEWSINSPMNSNSTILLSIAILTKLGIAPFHFWLPEVLQGLPLQTGLILSTWQKLAPMTLLFQFSESLNLNLMLSLGLLSTFLGGWGGINQTQIRKIMAFSSIAHMGWIILILKISPSLSLLNFTLYVIMTSTLFFTFMFINSKNILQLATSWHKTPAIASLSLLCLLSLSGLPPLTGFLPKWLIAQELIKQNLTTFALIALLSTLLSLFFYLRLTYTTSLTLAPNPSFSLSSWLFKKKTHLSPLTILTLCALPLSPSLLPYF
ncbi:NADH dehydrogenase subunit 2 (mitochondrion) [Phyllobates terribilis]|uniref:NADH-ubiquinone oxidoreductase chain 2 n=1 Tax=Phyllobates terribilis TaxID=111132 RepID=F4ZUG6_PHYTE|nr:NADH dehydrogenase subunit 2 [Phyllobates terribilis]AEB39356.1 NADH dehydrogenase subunit 2 [Phyllobates terribilis]ASV64512.1 NADH dehydrogenase subunit 2 [Phyllobates terribilis]